MATLPPKSVDIATRHAVHLERVKSGYVRRFDKFLGAMRKDILALLAEIDDPAKLSAKRLRAILATINKSIGKQSSGYESVWRAQIEELGKYSAEFEVKAMGKSVRHDFVLPTANQISAAAFSTPLSVEGVYGGQLLEPFFKESMQRSMRRVGQAVRLVSAQGGTTQDLVRRIIGKKVRGKYVDGLMNTIRRDAYSIARTSLHHVANVARETTWQANKDVIEYVEFVATLYGRTTAVCAGLSGRRFKLNEGPIPPLHVNCRSGRLPVFSDGLEFLDKAGSQFARGENGVQRVAADETYYSWLKKQPAGFQDSAIGPARGQLLRKGGLSAEEFGKLSLDRNFHPMTLAEMRKLEPVAFDRAGI